MTARRHHYVPRFLLAGFTDTGTADGTLHVMDLRKGRTWQSTPNGTAHRRDYYRVDAPGVEPDAFEVELSRMESRAADVIREAVNSLELPKEDGLDDLVRFLAVMVSRTPPTIDHHASQEGQLYRKLLHATIANPKGFETLKGRARAEGRPLDDATQEELLETLANSEISFPSTWTVERLSMLADTTYPFLRPRKWSLLLPALETDEFVCSDMPGVMHDPSPRPWFAGPSWAAPESEFSMPLTRDVLLMGRFDRESIVGAINTRSVALLNGRAMMYASQVYSAKPDFTWWTREERLGTADDLRAAIAARPTEDESEEDER